LTQDKRSDDFKTRANAGKCRCAADANSARPRGIFVRRRPQACDRADALAALRSKRHLPSLASLYNTLNEFCRAGLVREATLDGGAAWFDTRTEAHYHLFHEDEGRLEDISADALKITGRPRLPTGSSVRTIDVVIRVRRA
jgi:Fur family iron response transcriptional regulator